MCFLKSCKKWCLKNNKLYQLISKFLFKKLFLCSSTTSVLFVEPMTFISQFIIDAVCQFTAKTVYPNQR